ncbi:MAG TPA: hypothetical protein VKF16_12785 [Candidatus Dormibacteraeota bacterium]|nr:hypothetical protein [Candidatus Dormibacteraeota bacterium]
MRFAIRGAAALFLIVVLVGASACRLPGSPSGSTASSTRQASVAPSPVGPLDAAVPTPPAFPADVPVYPGARLTAGAAFSANGVTTWGMEWETLDSVDKVKAFYTNKLAQGDWTIQFNGGANGTFAATFSRKSNSKFAGILGADGTSGVTKISMSLAGS